MRYKKYRPFKAWLILVLSVSMFVFLALFLLDGWQKILILTVSGVLIAVMFFLFSYYFQVTEDRILLRHGVSSSNKQLQSYFQTKTILITEINTIDLIDSGQSIAISLKNGNSICFSIGGYFNRTEIIKLIYDIKKQIR